MANLIIWWHRRMRRKGHRAMLWRRIYELREEIIDDVLLATQDNKGLDNEALLHKARLVRKYSRRLKYIG